MASNGGMAAVPDRPSLSQPKKLKSRQVRSRFLSPATSSIATTSSSSSSSDYGNQSPNSNLIFSPLQKPKQPSINSRKHKSYENSGFFRGLWPSSSPSPSPSTGKPGDRSLTRKRSCTESRRFDDLENQIFNSAAKENQKPVLGGSMRCTRKFNFTENSDDNDVITAGRFSTDDSTMLRDSESECSDVYSGGVSLETPAAGKYFPASYMAPTVSSRKHGIEILSNFMHDLPSRSRRWSANFGLNQRPLVSSWNSVNTNKNNNSSKVFNLSMKKTNGNRASPPSQSGSGKSKLGDEKEKTKTKRVGNILSLGIGLLKGKKPSLSSLHFGPGSAEAVHQLKLLQNKLMQWKYINARAETVNGNVIKQDESNSLSVWYGLIKLQNSVVQNKLQLQRERLEMKLNYIIHSEVKALESWGNMETQYLSAVCTTIDYLHSVLCRVQLVDGAKVEPISASISVQQASDLSASINPMLAALSPTIEKTVGVAADLAMVVTQEKLLLQECLELCRNISILEMQERSLKSCIMQFNIVQQQQKHFLLVSK